jgi:hypothetical protein
MVKRRARWLAAVLCALAIGAAGSCHKPPSAETRSYYMARTGLSDAVQLGCANSVKSGRVSLYFGSPTPVAGTYGATLWGAPDLTVSQIGQRIKEFVRGYAFCRTNPRHRLIVGIGTSNSTIQGRADAWVRAHGDAWSRGVEALSAWAQGNFPGHVQIVGAWDVEPSWSSFAKAEQWMHGYDGNSGRRLLHVNSSADGCPTGSAANGACNNGWNQQRVWHMTWQHDPSLPFPQIYTRSANQARQWQLIDLWATTAMRDGMYFYGSMTQFGACRQVGGCQGTNNTPHQGNHQLRFVLASDRRTKQDDVVGMTDINWNT